MTPEAAEAGLENAARLLRAARRIVALTGAGISTDSGIPDFRGPQGVWTKDPKAERLATLHHYMSDPEVRRLAWKTRLNHPALRAAPNSGHRALADLERRGKLHTLVTQNIDGLHQLAGSSPNRVIEIHGNIREVVCMRCGERAPMNRALHRVRGGEADPPCRSCGGILKSATISFGQRLVPEDVAASQRAAATCNVFMAIGTSLAVYPAARLPEVAVDAGARLVILNGEPTRYDAGASAVVRAPLSEALPALAELV
jgi:NAD-dependent deacetylase